MVSFNDKPLLYCETPDAWRRWLTENHATSDGVRLQLLKKASTLLGINYFEALDEALCFGWIDGQAGRLDDDFSLQSFTPRRPRSPWSQRNREFVGRLTAEGRMQPSGLAQVEAAKADGRWDAAYRQKDAPVPQDLQAALGASPTAAGAFAALNSQNRFAIIFRLGNVKREETRARKIAEYVAMLEQGEALHPQKE